MNENYGKEEFGLNSSLLPIFLCFIFGTNTVAIKYSLSGLGVFASAAIRFFIAACAIFLWAKFSKRTFKIEKSDLKKIIITTIFFTANFSFYVLGLSKTTASRAVILLNMQPFYVLILAHFFIDSEKIDIKKILGMFIAFMGVISLFVFKKNISHGLLLGDFLVFLGASFWACNAVYIKSVIKNMEGFHLVFYPMILSIPLFAAESFFFDEHAIIFINSKVLYAVLYQALAVGSFGFISWNYLLKRYKASSLYSFVFIMPISGVLGSILILNEPLTINVLAALFLVAAGIITVHRPNLIFSRRS